MKFFFDGGPLEHRKCVEETFDDIKLSNHTKLLIPIFCKPLLFDVQELRKTSKQAAFIHSANLDNFRIRIFIDSSLFSEIDGTLSILSIIFEIIDWTVGVLDKNFCKNDYKKPAKTVESCVVYSRLIVTAPNSRLIPRG